MSTGLVKSVLTSAISTALDGVLAFKPARPYLQKILPKPGKQGRREDQIALGRRQQVEHWSTPSSSCGGYRREPVEGVVREGLLLGLPDCRGACGWVHTMPEHAFE